MRTSAEKPHAPPQQTAVKPVATGPTHAEVCASDQAPTASTGVGHDFSRIHVRPPAAGSTPTNLAVRRQGDADEPVADHAAEPLGLPPAAPLQRACTCGGGCHAYQASSPDWAGTHQPATRAESGGWGPAAVPPAVHDVLRAAGQPLDPTIRTFMEPRFGHDFSRVRVHTDAAAAASAQYVSASAYTVGRHIVFGAGQFRPGTEAGWRVLAHELTHVVQQRRAPLPTVLRLSLPGDAHERHAGAVAEALMQGDDIAGVLDAGPGPTCPALQRDTPQAPPPTPPKTAPPRPRPLDYDRALKHIPLLDRKHTAASLTALLNDKVKKGDIARFVVTGVQKGSRAEIFLLGVLYSLAEKSRWGTEADIVTAIDWPAKPGAVAPQGRVTVRIDPQGAASAELLAAGPVPAVAQTTVADGSARLKADFGFAAVTGWSEQNPKAAAEISDVLAALELLKSRAPLDIPALKGVELMRVPSLKNGRAGEFFAGSQVVLGAQADVKPYLKLADRAFEANALQFAGGGPGAPTVPASFQVILHEVGHAVETDPLRLAREGFVQAAAEEAAAKKLVAGDPAAFDAELKAAQRQGKRAVAAFHKRQAAAYKKNVEAQERASERKSEEAAKLEGTKAPGSERTRRLQKFIDLVTAHDIRRFTQYSVENWPQHPEEFYAEAYSLWLVDPVFLRTQYKVVYDFFQSGDYRQ
jgi:hypothetical protein